MTFGCFGFSEFFEGIGPQESQRLVEGEDVILLTCKGLRVITKGGQPVSRGFIRGQVGRVS